MRHVADRVDVDQRADARDQQHEEDGELIDEEADLDAPVPRRDPLVERNVDCTSTFVGTEHLQE